MLTLNMRSFNAITLGLCLSNAFAYVLDENFDVSASADFDLTVDSKALQVSEKKKFDFNESIKNLRSL